MTDRHFFRLWDKVEALESRVAALEALRAPAWQGPTDPPPPPPSIIQGPKCGTCGGSGKYCTVEGHPCFGEDCPCCNGTGQAPPHGEGG